MKHKGSLDVNPNESIESSFSTKSHFIYVV